ncbi:alginate lyase family protein [Erwinia sp. MYb535]|uniref:alginate lyase family protein n=1 Tax=Erwinia sp. MYb535 TaxID=2745309 RepID=UPI0030B01101
MPGDERYADRAIALIRHWFLDPATRMNPNLNWAQSVPGKAEGRRSGVLDGRYFATRIVDSLLMLRTAPGWRPQDEQQMQQWMSDYLHWLQTLTLAWYFSGDERYADRAIALIRHWFLDPATRMNPNLNWAQSVPGKAEGRRSGVLDGRYFATRIVDSLLMLRTAPGWRPQDEQQMQQWMSDYLHWLQTLTLAWYFSGDERYADRAIALIRHWFLDPATRMNPNLNWAQSVPGKAEGRRSGVLDGRYFATRIVDSLLMLRTAPGWRPQDEQQMQQWMSDYLHWLQTLTLAWYFSGDERYADRAIALIRHWFLDPATRMNPNLNWAQSVPGKAEGRRSGVLDGRYFATRIVDSLLMLRTAPGWRPQDEQQMQQWMSDYLQCLLVAG